MPNPSQIGRFGIVINMTLETLGGDKINYSTYPIYYVQADLDDFGTPSAENRSLPRMMAGWYYINEPIVVYNF